MNLERDNESPVSVPGHVLEPDLHTCQIESLAYGGDGIARIDGQVIFIPETLPGETVRIRITQRKKSFARGVCVDLLKSSPDRVTPCCRILDEGVSFRVPGCVYDHADYAAEIRFKQQQLEGFMRHLPLEDVFRPPVPSPHPVHYRNKITLHAQHDPDRLTLGYLREPSHRVLDLPECPLAIPEINHALRDFRGHQPTTHLLKDGDHIVFRHTAHDGVVWSTRRGITSPECPRFLTETSPIGAIQLPMDGFFQVNPAVHALLLREVGAAFSLRTDCPEILDLYCGVGLFGLFCMTQGGTRLTGIESGFSAVSCATRNAASLKIKAQFHSQALGLESANLSTWITTPHQTTVIVDPPREGMHRSIAQALAKRGVQRVFYISCDPATLTRDLVILLASGQYRISHIQLFDMFPRTAHFETLVLLEAK